jgi:NDP-4-keto-2,6-dideoxyhexose 3-C-methyltransferase
MRSILKDVADEARTVRPVGAGDVVLDIGGNDGTLLANFVGETRALVNIDAAHGVQPVVSAENYVKVTGLFDKETYGNLGLPSPRLVFSVAMFYHLDDPVSFCRDVAALLEGDAVWCLQMTYLGPMLEENIYDNVVHEHVAYYSLQSLEHLLARVGLRAFHARVVPSYGGSLRVFIERAATPAPRVRSMELLAIRDRELRTGLRSPGALVRFNERIQTLRTVTRNWLDALVTEEGKLVALGASTKGNMICQFLGIGSDHVKFVLDNSEKKAGSIMVGSDIPIVLERDHLHELGPHAFVLPYYYTDFFRELVAKRSAGKTRSLFVPLPYPRLVKV